MIVASFLADRPLIEDGSCRCYSQSRQGKYAEKRNRKEQINGVSFLKIPVQILFPPPYYCDLRHEVFTLRLIVH